MKEYIKPLLEDREDFGDMPSWYSRREQQGNFTNTELENRTTSGYEWGDLVGYDLPDFEEYCNDRSLERSSPSAWENYIYYCENAYEDIKNNR